MIAFDQEHLAPQRLAIEQRQRRGLGDRRAEFLDQIVDQRFLAVLHRMQRAEPNMQPRPPGHVADIARQQARHQRQHGVDRIGRRSAAAMHKTDILGRRPSQRRPIVFGRLALHPHDFGDIGARWQFAQHTPDLHRCGGQLRQRPLAVQPPQQGALIAYPALDNDAREIAPPDRIEMQFSLRQMPGRPIRILGLIARHHLAAAIYAQDFDAVGERQVERGQRGFGVRPKFDPAQPRWRQRQHFAIVFHHEKRLAARRQPPPGLQQIQRPQSWRETVKVRIGGHGRDGEADQYIDREIEFDVERLNLYVFDTGVAMVALQVGVSKEPCVRPVEGASRAMTLADALDFTDYFRRCYIPYWDSYGAGLFPKSVQWGDAKALDVPTAETVLRDFPAGAKSSHAGAPRLVPVVDWWAKLLPAGMQVLRPATETAPTGTTFWNHIVDDRLPAMTYLAVDDPLKISRGDWQRLCFADQAGGSPLPYAAGFMANFEADHCYDRFWYGDPHNDPVKEEPTRYLVAGYHFAVVGRATSTNPDKVEPSFFRNLIANHFERHYYQMGLICHFQNAALLAFSDRLSHAVQQFDLKHAQDKFRARINELEAERLKFTHKYWFTGVSNQVQARELYEAWRTHLGVERLYAEVSEEAHATNGWLEQQAQGRSASASEALGKGAAAVAVVGLPMAFFGMNKFPMTFCESDLTYWSCLSNWSPFFAALVISGVGLVAFYYLVSRKRPQ